MLSFIRAICIFKKIHFNFLVASVSMLTIGKQMNDRGFAKIRKGQKKITNYKISKKSKVIGLLDYDTLVKGGITDAKRNNWEPF